jgi:predicted Rossmann fold nucleotide-binding protein DprA/Smf involved in DNA uptake
MALTQLPQEVVHPDTQAVLLLCGTFGAGGGPEAKPLTPAEYNSLASWLARQGRRPADLLQRPDELLAASEPDLPPPQRVRALLERGVQMATALERWQRLGLWVVSRGEDRYPERLRRALPSAAPALLYGAGDMTRLDLGGLAIIGSRDIDEEGLSFTRRVAERCACDGVQVVSGGARGVDQAAVAAALDAGGGAVAVLAEKLDRAATARDAKGPLRRGLLTLVSPYEPESHFTVAGAMGRNKYIYGLADYALVVRFTAGEGGTWAGAVEQLRHNKKGAVYVPVFIRSTPDQGDGWGELHDKGALPFPEDEFWKGPAADVLRRAAAVPADRSPAEPVHTPAVTPPAPEASAAPSPEHAAQPEAAEPPCQESAAQGPSSAPMPAPLTEAETCYSRCLPLLLQHLQQGPGEKQLSGIAKQLDILPGQLKQWLKRAIEEGKVRKEKRKNRFVYLDALREEGSTLFGRVGGAA